jgi:hypothetical protein
MIAHPIRSTRDERVKLCEMLFEKFDVGSLHLQPSPVLAMYATGELNGLAVEIGHSLTQIVPVYDGIPLKQRNSLFFLRKRFFALIRRLQAAQFRWRTSHAKDDFASG